MSHFLVFFQNRIGIISGKRLCDDECGSLELIALYRQFRIQYDSHQRGFDTGCYFGVSLPQMDEVLDQAIQGRFQLFA